DMSYLQPDSGQWDLSTAASRERGAETNLQGRPAPKTYDVILYTDRGAYRPGETVHLTGIIRDAAGATPPAFPLTVSVRRPDDRVTAELPIHVQPQGVFHTDYVAKDENHLGPYRFEAALPGSAEILGQTQALVEEFLPVRLEVTACPSLARFGPEQPVQIQTSARYLFGQPASGMAITLSGRIRPDVFRSHRYPDYSFDAAEQASTKEITEVKATLDETGQASINLNETLESFSLPRSARVPSATGQA